MGKALEIVNKFMQEQDVTLVADDVKFIGPVDQAEGKASFMKLNADFFPLVRGMRMLQQFENGNEVCSIYEMDVQPPNSDVMTLKVSDWTTVRDGKVAEVKIYYDPREYVTALNY